MKIFLTAFAMYFLINTDAHAELKPIHQESLDQYTGATALAVTNSTMRKCYYVSDSGKNNTQIKDPSDRPDLLAGWIADAEYAEIDDSGQQPLLVFYRYKNPDLSDVTKLDTVAQSSISVTTSQDYKSILSVKQEDFSLRKVNKGDLRHPSLGFELVFSRGFVCEY